LFTPWTSLNLAAGPVKQGSVSAEAGLQGRPVIPFLEKQK